MSNKLTSTGRVVTALLGLVCLGAAGAAVYSAAVGHEPAVQPGLYPDEQYLDFGELAQGDVQSGQFRLTNRHPEPIEVVDVLTGCSCNEATPSSRQVPPGDRFTIDIKWSVGPRRGRLADVVQVVYQTASGGRHMAELGVKANVIPDIHYSPNVLTFDPDRPGTAVVRFTHGRRNPFVLRRASTTQAAFQVVLDADKAEVTVTFDPTAWIGIGSDPWLRVDTDSDRQPTISIRLQVGRSPTDVGPKSGF